MISELIEMSIGQCHQALPALKIDESLSHCNYAKLEATSILKYQYLGLKIEIFHRFFFG